MTPQVSIARAPGQDLDSLGGAVREALTQLGISLGNLVTGKRVLIKPNITADSVSWETGVVTNPNLVHAVVKEVLKHNPAEVTIAEAIAVGLDVGKAFCFLGYDRIADATGARLVDLYQQPFRSVSVPGGLRHSALEVSAAVLDAECLIVVPVMKTHVAAGISVCMKCLMGTLSAEQKKKFHYAGLLESIVDLNAVIQPHLFIVDGTVAGQGDGPMANEPVGLSLVMAGRDACATDSVCAQVMGFEAGELGFLELARKTLGKPSAAECKVTGVPVSAAAVQFKRAASRVRERPGVRCVNGGACESCAGVVDLALGRMEAMGLLEKLPSLHIYLGPEAPMPEGKQPNVIIGRCLQLQSGRGRFVPGCPPQVFLVTDELREMAGLPRAFGAKEDYVFPDMDAPPA